MRQACRMLRPEISPASACIGEEVRHKTSPTFDYLADNGLNATIAGLVGKAYVRAQGGQRCPRTP